MNMWVVSTSVGESKYQLEGEVVLKRLHKSRSTFLALQGLRWSGHNQPGWVCAVLPLLPSNKIEAQCETSLVQQNAVLRLRLSDHDLFEPVTSHILLLAVPKKNILIAFSWFQSKTPGSQSYQRVSALSSCRRCLPSRPFSSPSGSSPET